MNNINYNSQPVDAIYYSFAMQARKLCFLAWAERPITKKNRRQFCEQAPIRSPVPFVAWLNCDKINPRCYHQGFTDNFN